MLKTVSRRIRERAKSLPRSIIMTDSNLPNIPWEPPVTFKPLTFSGYIEHLHQWATAQGYVTASTGQALQAEREALDEKIEKNLENQAAFEVLAANSERVLKSLELQRERRRDAPSSLSLVDSSPSGVQGDLGK